MYAHNVVAFFSSLEGAEKAKIQLTSAGIDHASIRSSADSPVSRSEKVEAEEEQGLFEWVFGSNVPDREREVYRSNLQDGRTALSVRVDEQGEIAKVERLLAEAGAMKVERDGKVVGSGSVQR